MTATVLPDAEKLTVDWALDNTAVSTALSDRIYTAIPASPTFPLARVTRVGGAPSQRPLWLDNALLQWDVWGGPKATARLIAETIRAEMDATFRGVHDLGTVTEVAFGSFLWLPDVDFEPARPRYTFDVTVTLHP